MYVVCSFVGLMIVGHGLAENVTSVEKCIPIQRLCFIVCKDWDNIYLQISFNYISGFYPENSPEILCECDIKEFAKGKPTIVSVECSSSVHTQGIYPYYIVGIKVVIAWQCKQQ